MYAYGNGEQRTEIVDGRVRKRYGHRRPMAEWEVVLKDHHEGYIDWVEFERNQAQLAANADEILRVVEPLAVEASLKAERVHLVGLNEQQRAAELDLQQARYEASPAERATPPAIQTTG